jgi:sigma-E factor negative regulatory protein RseC
MKRSVEHRGIVERIEDNVVMVKVERQSACAGCHAKGLCGESGQERIIEVRTPNAKEFQPAERGIVALERETMGFMSVVWAYLLPLVLLLAVLFTAHALGLGDGPAAIASLTSTAAYYVMLYILRRHIDRKIKFTIIKE